MLRDRILQIVVYMYFHRAILCTYQEYDTTPLVSGNDGYTPKYSPDNYTPTSNWLQRPIPIKPITIESFAASCTLTPTVKFTIFLQVPFSPTNRPTGPTDPFSIA